MADRPTRFPLGSNRDAHNERLKFIANAIHAVGLAAVVGGFFGPMLTLPTRALLPASAMFGLVFWVMCLVVSLEVLGYIRSKD